MYLMVNVNCFVEDKNLTFCEILIFLSMIFLWFYRIYYRLFIEEVIFMIMYPILASGWSIGSML